MSQGSNYYDYVSQFNVRKEKEHILTKPKKAAVLVPLFRNEESEIVVVLVRRTEGEIHGGQIAFPGGKFSGADESLLDTALRETHEEIGLSPERVRIIRTLPDVVTNSSNFIISPFLGKIKKPDTWKLSKNEIAEVIESPVNELMNRNLHGREIMTFPNWPAPKKVPFIRVGRHKLWGASYRILYPILEEILGV